MTRSGRIEHKANKEVVEVDDEDISSSSSSSDTDNNNLPANANVHVFSRSETKARKQILKHGLKQMTGIIRVTLFRPKNVLFVISNPDVYKLPNSDTYIVFGQVKIEDINSEAQLNAVQQFANTTQNTKSSSVTLRAAHNKPLIAEDDDPDNLDETGLQSKDIDLVMDQTKVSRSKAIKALRENNGDIVNAIMSIAI
ncbi:hypothetical protein PCANB_000440 [Pneumocystis canis]|nr:hypothetical protein PCK1_000514 [Pneumocystis canis]KAG5437727.1 hypothetical protein PCANB_000440 [Pneumocystis canis]